ncbi:hypothetical protein MMC07_000026 [Pseudocyphellaria aurata]|nr:hypothetical protein [Pseudocyphellaria aurata]
MNEGSTVSMGGHSTDWDDAFPSTLKSLKDTKSSALHILSLDSDVFPADSFSSSSPQQFQVSDQSINPGQQPEPPLVASSNINAADFPFNLNTPLGPVSVAQPAIVPENLVGDGGNPLLFASINSPDFTALEPDGDIAGV